MGECCSTNTPPPDQQTQQITAGPGPTSKPEEKSFNKAPTQEDQEMVNNVTKNPGPYPWTSGSQGSEAEEGCRPPKRRGGRAQPEARCGRTCQRDAAHHKPEHVSDAEEGGGVRVPKQFSSRPRNASGFHRTSSITGRSTRDNGSSGSGTARASKFGATARCMRASGRTTKPTARETDPRRR